MSAEEDFQAERSRLLNKQKKDRTDLEKNVKKAKGAMKETAQQKLEDMEQAHEKELADLDKSRSSGGKSAASGGKSAASDKAAAKASDKSSAGASAAGYPAEAEKKAPVAAEASGADLVDASLVRDRNWSGLSKKELEEECTKRGIGKKGSKEDLVVRVMTWISDNKDKAAPPPAAEAKASKPGKPAKKGDVKKAAKDEDEDGSSSGDGDDSSSAGGDEEEDADSDDDEGGDGPEVDAEEQEKQFKREQAMHKPIRHLLTKHPDGFEVDKLPELLAGINVRGFTPEICGYPTLDKFARKQPERLLRYDKKTKMVFPPQ